MSESNKLLEVDCHILEAQKLMEKAQELMKAKAEKLRNEEAAFEEMSKKLDRVHFSSSIKLNIGGHIFKTSLATLQKDPDSMLAAMFSGRFEVKPEEDDGAYFIDRDGTYFRYILNYLRNGKLVCPLDEMVREEILIEAEFYQIQGITKKLNPDPELSSIVNESKASAQWETLLSWISGNRENLKITLLYQATKDGWNASSFHSKCDDKGPTLVLIKSGDYIFGGYTTKQWTSPNSTSAIEDAHSFLFTLNNPVVGRVPIRLHPRADAVSGSKGGIRCHQKSGPVFGTKTYYDLSVKLETSQPTRGDLDLEFGFTCPANADKNNYFTGGSPFVMDEIEVFEVIN